MSRLAACHAVLGLALSACVTSPETGADAPAGTSAIAFAGVAPWQPGQAVSIAYEDSSGTAVLLGTARVARNGAWSATVHPPKAAWWRAPCHQARFRFTTSSGQTLVGLDRTCVATLPPSPTQAQVDACYPPHVDLARPLVHVGDLALVGQADADAHACVTELQGNLTVDAGRQPAGPGWAQGITFRLPLLRLVTGNVALDGARAQELSLPRLEAVGGDLSLLSTQFLAWPLPFVPSDPPAQTTTAFGLGRLTAVGGSVSLTTADDHSLHGGTTFHDFGLDALTSLGADLVVHNPVFPAAPLGLRRLSAIPRDLLYDWGPTDLDSTDFLPALRSVGRDAVFTLPPNSRTALGALQAVGRDLSVGPASLEARFGTGFAPALRSVGGDAVLVGTGVELACATSLGGLEQVAGTLRITGGSPETAFGATGAAHLTMGALAIDGASATHVPLHADAAVAASGPVSITGAPHLCACQVDAFAAGLVASGWAGALTSSGNGALAACTPCPATTCP